MNQISFSCPACKTVLQVPVEMAGVTGPCPRCGTSISSPQATPSPPPPTPAPSAPTPQTPQPNSPPSQQLESPNVESPPPAQPYAPPSYQRTESPTERMEYEDHQPQAKAKKGGCLLRLLFPILFFFCTATGALFILFVNGKLNIPYLEKILNLNEPDQETSQIGDESNDDENLSLLSEEGTTKKKSSPSTDDEHSTEGETPPPTAIDAIDPEPKESAAASSYSALMEFFFQSSFEDRQGLFTTKSYEREQLEQSFIANRIPAPLKSRYEKSFETEKTKDLTTYYSIYLSKGLKDPPSWLLVQLHREDLTKPFRLNVDPFIELYGDTMTQFSKNAAHMGIRVHAVVEAIRTNFNDRIPNSKEWGYLKIKKHPKEKEFFRAYFKLNSRLAEMIERQGSPGWLNPYPARIHLSWNTENEEYPFIQALKIDHFSWKP